MTRVGKSPSAINSIASLFALFELRLLRPRDDASNAPQNKFRFNRAGDAPSVLIVGG